VKTAILFAGAQEKNLQIQEQEQKKRSENFLIENNLSYFRIISMEMIFRMRFLAKV
jgi:hypothetical protein